MDFKSIAFWIIYNVRVKLQYSKHPSPVLVEMALFLLTPKKYNSIGSYWKAIAVKKKKKKKKQTRNSADEKQRLKNRKRKLR